MSLITTVETGFCEILKTDILLLSNQWVCFQNNTTLAYVLTQNTRFMCIWSKYWTLEVGAVILMHFLNTTFLGSWDSKMSILKQFKFGF